MTRVLIADTLFSGAGRRCDMASKLCGGAVTQDPATVNIWWDFTNPFDWLLLLQLVGHPQLWLSVLQTASMQSVQQSMLGATSELHGDELGTQRALVRARNEQLREASANTPQVTIRHIRLPSSAQRPSQNKTFFEYPRFGN